VQTFLVVFGPEKAKNATRLQDCSIASTRADIQLHTHYLAHGLDLIKINRPENYAKAFGLCDTLNSFSCNIRVSKTKEKGKHATAAIPNL